MLRGTHRPLLDADVAMDLLPPEVQLEVRRAATIPIPVLITGETGTGKSTVARQIHRLSARASGPLVEVDCTTLTPTLIEAELYGNERGAYTDAKDARSGLVQLADRGMLFLDEIAELPYTAQGKLLRVVESGEFRRVGATTIRRVDARIISATHRDLHRMVAKRQFRADLFWRCLGYHIHLPSLRERPDLISRLALHLVLRNTKRYFGSDRPPDVSADFLDTLAHLHLPGNVRELDHLVTTALVTCDSSEITAKHLPRQTANGGIFAAPDSAPHGHALRLANKYRRPASLDEERRIIIRALSRSRGNKAESARSLGMSRTVLYERIRLFGIRTDEYTSPSGAYVTGTPVRTPP